MLIEIDFNSDEALYVQLQNQIIMRIPSICPSACGYGRYQYAYSE